MLIRLIRRQRRLWLRLLGGAALQSGTCTTLVFESSHQQDCTEWQPLHGRSKFATLVTWHLQAATANTEAGQASR